MATPIKGDPGTTRRISVRLATTLLTSLVLSACVTSSQSRGSSSVQMALAPADFQPVTYVSRIHRGDSRYPDLFSTDSFAIWVGDDVAELKLEKEREGGAPIDMSLEQAASLIGDNYYVFECHFESAFPDASIAYDVVGLRNIDLVLVTPDGGRVRPIQRIMDSHAEQGDRGALKRFQRTNIVVFPKHDIISGYPTLAGEISGLRLAVEGFHSDFYFEWEALPPDPPAEDTLEAEAGRRWSPSESEAYQAVKVGFTELFAKLRILTEHTH